MKQYPNGLTVKDSNVIIEDCDISNPSGVGLKITGDNVTVRNCVIHDTKDHGVLFLGTRGGTLENCEVHHAAMRNKPNTISGGWPSLVKVQSVDESPNGLAQNIIIRNNYIHHGYGEGMGLRGSNIEVYGNTVEDCYSFGIYSNSDHVHIHNNFVVARDRAYYRGGYPMAGIGGAEETFAKWGAHGHDSATIENNIVVGCKYGYRYGRSDNGKGLVNVIIAFNTFSDCKNTPVSVTYYSNQKNLLVANNIANKTISVKGAEVFGNVVLVTSGDSPLEFAKLPKHRADERYFTQLDFGGNVRTRPANVGAWE